MAHFSGTIINRIDAKGRVSLPARFRQSLIAQGSEEAIIVPFDGQSALQGFGPSYRAEFDQRLSRLPIDGDDYLALALEPWGESAELPWDSEGRIRLPESFIAHAKLTEQVVFVGLNIRFLIWEPQAHEAWRAKIAERARELRGQLDRDGGRRL